jgi:hypothetical protein
MACSRTATDPHAEKRCRGAGADSAEAAIASGTAADTRRSVELKVNCGCKRDVWAEWSAIYLPLGSASEVVTMMDGSSTRPLGLGILLFVLHIVT